MTPAKNNAFTLIELITVLAIGAILMAMVLPLAQGARHQYALSETKARFHRYTLALEQFKAEYGFYPSMDGNPIQTSSSPMLINSTPNRFIELMTGHAITGGAMTDPIAQQENPKALSFITFTNNELTSDGQLQDSLGQTNIDLYYDADGDGYLDSLSGVRGTIGWQSSGSETITSWQ